MRAQCDRRIPDAWSLAIPRLCTLTAQTLVARALQDLVSRQRHLETTTQASLAEGSLCLIGTGPSFSTVSKVSRHDTEPPSTKLQLQVASIGAAAQPAWLLMFLSGKQCTLLLSRLHTSLAYSLAARSFQDSPAPAFWGQSPFSCSCGGSLTRPSGQQTMTARRLATEAAPGNSPRRSRILTELTSLPSLPLIARCVKQTDVRRQEGGA